MQTLRAAAALLAAADSVDDRYGTLAEGVDKGCDDPSPCGLMPGRVRVVIAKVGLSGADMGSAYLLPRLIGAGRAMELLLLGDRVDAEQAVALGLASQVVEDAALASTAKSLARRLAEGPALAYAATKLLVTRELDMNLAASLELDTMTQAMLMRSRDHGVHWEDAGLPGKLESSVWTVATNAADPKLIFAATALGQYFRSSDGGESWTALPRRLAETRALTWVPA